MAGLFGGGQQPAIPPAPAMPVIQETPEPAPVPDEEAQKRAALKQSALNQSRLTTRKSTIIGDEDTLG